MIFCCFVFFFPFMSNLFLVNTQQGKKAWAAFLVLKAHEKAKFQILPCPNLIHIILYIKNLYGKTDRHHENLSTSEA